MVKKQTLCISNIMRIGIRERAAKHIANTIREKGINMQYGLREKPYNYELQQINTLPFGSSGHRPLASHIPEKRT